MWYLQHRLSAQVVAPLSDVHLHVRMKIPRTNKTRSREPVRDIRWPGVWSNSCFCVWRGTSRTPPDQEKKSMFFFLKKGTPAPAAAVRVYPMTPSEWQTSGTCTRGTLELHSHLWGNSWSSRALLSLHKMSLKKNLLCGPKSSKKVYRKSDARAKTRTKEVKK